MKSNSFTVGFWLRRRFTLLAQVAIVAGALVAGNMAHGFAYYQNEVFKHGAVMARAMVLDENGQPILVEYGPDGREVGEVALGGYSGQVNQLQIISAYEWRVQEARLEDYREQHKDDLAQDAELMNRAEFLSGSFITADGKTIDVPELPEYVKSVFVRGRSNRIIADPEQLVLLAFSVDLTQTFVPPATGSVVINTEGVAIASSPHNIAPRAAFFGDPNEEQVNFTSMSRKAEDEIFGPVSGVKVFVDEIVFPGGVAATDSDGRYSMRFRLPPCPGFSFEYTTDIWAELHYTNFSPTGAPALPYFLRAQDWSWCHGVSMPGVSLGAAMAYTNAVATLATMSVPNYNIDLKVDVMFLTGRIVMKNHDGSPITVGDATTYTTEAPSANLINQQHYDFDGDGVDDRSELGNLVEKPLPDGGTEKVFEAAAGGSLQGVYFSSTPQTEDQQPDVIRLADTEKNLNSTGVLATISKDDFKNTDILVFRESTGQLVIERRGLRDEEIDGRKQMGLGENDDNIFYRIMLRGPKDHGLNIGGTNRSGSWTEWSTRNQLTEPFRARDSDHLKPGEFIRIVVINRATGYMGTQRVQLSGAGENPGAYLNVPVEDMVMMPPNLKIWAERTYDVEKGMTEGEERRFLIGSEGASLASDAMIQVFSEWYDHDGRPLPEGLGIDDGEQYGLTGRLAKVVSANTLDAVAHNQLANFPIAPGRQTQVLRVRDNLTAPEHFYIHVSGTQKDEGPQFDAGAEGTGVDISARPRVLTPFLTPLYDENDDWETYNAYRDILRDRAEQENPDPETEPLRPLPSYVWSYRPEYQFSQYDLEVAEINRVNPDDAGGEDKENIFDLSTPTIGTSDELIELLYSLVGNEIDRLAPIDGPQDLVLALGEEEVKLTLGEEQQIRIDNLDHLASLSPEDFLTMRLYANQDAGNILWEYAFQRLSVSIPKVAGLAPLEISVDEANNFALHGVLHTYTDEPFRASWTASGGTVLANSAALSQTSDFYNKARLPTTANTLVNLKVATNGSGAVEFHPLKMVAGEPHTISVQQAGKTAIEGVGFLLFNVHVVDQYGNPVREGTPVELRSPALVGETLKLTADGHVTFEMSGANLSGNQPVTIIAGDIVETVSAHIHDISVSIEVADEIPIGQTASVTVTATSTYGDLTGLPVDISAVRGAIPSNSIVLGSGNMASFPMDVGDFRGEGSVYAYFGDIVSFKPFSVVEDKSFYLLDTVLVEGGGGVGSFQIGSETYQYTGRTAAVVQGTPGGSANLSLVDYLIPPMLAELEFPMSRAPDPVDQRIRDEMVGAIAQTQNVKLVSSPFNTQKRAFQFLESSGISIDYPNMESETEM